MLFREDDILGVHHVLGHSKVKARDELCKTTDYLAESSSERLGVQARPSGREVEAEIAHVNGEQTTSPEVDKVTYLKPEVNLTT